LLAFVLSVGKRRFSLEVLSLFFCFFRYQLKHQPENSIIRKIYRTSKTLSGITNQKSTSTL
jgi:hypothetical protein